MSIVLCFDLMSRFWETNGGFGFCYHFRFGKNVLLCILKANCVPVEAKWNAIFFAIFSLLAFVEKVRS